MSVSVNETVLASVDPWISRVADSCLDLWAVQGPLGCADSVPGSLGCPGAAGCGRS